VRHYHIKGQLTATLEQFLILVLQDEHAADTTYYNPTKKPDSGTKYYACRHKGCCRKLIVYMKEGGQVIYKFKGEHHHPHPVGPYMLTDTLRGTGPRNMSIHMREYIAYKYRDPAVRDQTTLAFKVQLYRDIGVISHDRDRTLVQATSDRLRYHKHKAHPMFKVLNSLCLDDSQACIEVVKAYNQEHDFKDLCMVQPKSGDQKFAWVYASRFMGLLAEDSPNFFLDATFAVNRYSYSLYSCVCQDGTGKGATIGYFIVEENSGEQIQWCLTHLREFFRHQPEWVLLDHAWEEINAVTAAFPESKIAQCIFHVKKNWKEKLHKHPVVDLLCQCLVSGGTPDQIRTTILAYVQCNQALPEEDPDRLNETALKYIRAQIKDPFFSQWVHGHLPRGDRPPTTNNFVEKQFDTLKHKLLTQAAGLRLDKLIYELMYVVAPTLEHHMNDYIYGHQKADKPSDDRLVCISESNNIPTRHVLSSNVEGVYYVVSQTEYDQWLVMPNTYMDEGEIVDLCSKHRVDLHYLAGKYHCDCPDYERLRKVSI
ncbi:hypothetical protein KIPB_011590, partial [Kipferlia bialata]